MAWRLFGACGAVIAAAIAGCSFDWSAAHEPPGAGGAPTCPSDAPNDGGACSIDGMLCEYGSDPRPACRLRLTCDGGTWQVAQGCACPPTGHASCPPSDESPAPTCPPEGMLCEYGDGKHCGCPPGGTWTCPDSEDNCPEDAPEVGQSCSNAGLECEYGACDISTGIKRLCSDGVWIEQSPGCTNAAVMCM